ncbi:MAG: cytochrome c-type biogenesis protein CcmH [Alphaproteobacteria bacterium]|nr:cytochrome c-type biogenesis protein CcmH [Alphaproteobacteria bacterium]
MLLTACLAVIAAGSAHAVQPDEILSDANLEKRAREISIELRCLVCQNQSIDDSDAPLARDLRILVRERLQKGDTDDEVLDFIVSRYGEFVLLKPPFGWHTLLLWLAPLLALGAGVWLARSVFAASQPRESRSGSLDAGSLTADEELRLKRILEGKQSS